MIDDHGVELACLYALGLLDQTEAAELDNAAAPGSTLQNLVRDLSEAAAALALAASTSPPPALRSRVLAAIGSRAEGGERS